MQPVGGCSKRRNLSRRQVDIESANHRHAIDLLEKAVQRAPVRKRRNLQKDGLRRRGLAHGLQKLAKPLRTGGERAAIGGIRTAQVQH
jgi:hypothetical protein